MHTEVMLFGGIGLGAGLLYMFANRRNRRRVRAYSQGRKVILTGSHLASLEMPSNTTPPVYGGVEVETRRGVYELTGRVPGSWKDKEQGMKPYGHERDRKISLWIKIPYTLFICVLVPVYMRKYGPANFLWFSDVALLGTFLAVWRESSLLASTQAVSVALLEGAWIFDFLCGLVAGAESPLGLASYMFDPKISLPLRALSLFHLVLPPLLIWLVYRLGYDSRAWVRQTLVAWTILPACYFFTTPAANINWVFSPGEKPQTWMPAPLYFLLVMLVFPFCIYLPTHLAFCRLFHRPQAPLPGPDTLPSEVPFVG